MTILRLNMVRCQVEITFEPVNPLIAQLSDLLFIIQKRIVMPQFLELTRHAGLDPVSS